MKTKDAIKKDILILGNQNTQKAGGFFHKEENMIEWKKYQCASTILKKIVAVSAKKIHQVALLPFKRKVVRRLLERLGLLVIIG